MFVSVAIGGKFRVSRIFFGTSKFTLLIGATGRLLGEIFFFGSCLNVLGLISGPALGNLSLLNVL